MVGRSRLSGAEHEVLKAADGVAEMEMLVQPNMINGHGVPRSYLFTLLTALAYA